MSLWIFLAILAQIFSAFTVFIDKYVLVSKQGFQNPTAFAFYTALLSGIVVVLLPFGIVSWPSIPLILLSLCSSVLYVASLIFLYRTLQNISVTETIPITAAASAIATGILATIFLQQDLPGGMIPSFIFLILGTFLIYCFCFSWKYFAMAVASGALVGAATFAVKLAFSHADFWTALFWTLFSNVIVAVLLLIPTRFSTISHAFKVSSSGTKWLALLSKALGGFAFFLSFIAISLGSVSIINALGGLQLVFLLVLVPLFLKFLPKIFHDEFLPGTVVLKIIGIVCIVLGLAALFLF